MGFKRNIRLFFVEYGRLLLYIIGIILAIIYIVQSANNYVKEKNKSKELTEEEKVEIIQKQENQQETKKIITTFIDYCKSKQIEKAYNMLSDECKSEKYDTIEKFKNKFIINKFNINISDYNVIYENNKYIVKLTEDMLITGKTDSIKKITLTTNNENNKIYIFD